MRQRRLPSSNYRIADTAAVFRSSPQQAGRAVWEVLGLLGLLAVLGVGAHYLLGQGSAVEMHALTVERMEQVIEALHRYALDNGGSFPTAEQGLKALVEEPAVEPRPLNWRGPYLKDPQARFDAWGREFRYVMPGAGDPPRAFDLWSFGADNREGGEGADADVNSWDPSTLLPPRS